MEGEGGMDDGDWRMGFGEWIEGWMDAWDEKEGLRLVFSEREYCVAFFCTDA